MLHRISPWRWAILTRKLRLCSDRRQQRYHARQDCAQASCRRQLSVPTLCSQLFSPRSGNNLPIQWCSNSLRTFVKTTWSIPVLPVSLLYRSSEHDGCKYSACTSPGEQQATANTPLPRGHPITDDFVRIGVTRGLGCPR